MLTPLRILNFYVNSSFHVALSVIALCSLTVYELGLHLPNQFFLVVFFGSILGYNFIKYFGLARFHYRSLTSRLKEIQLLSIVSLIGFVYFFTHLLLPTKILIFIFGGVTFLYAMPLIPSRMISLRSVSGLKIYVIAFVWTSVTVLLPMVETQCEITMNCYIIYMQRFLFIVVLMFPFEIRDLNFDSLKLITIPQKIGICNTKILGYTLSVVIIILEFFKTDIHWVWLGIFTSVIIKLCLFLRFSSVNNKTMYSALWVEAVPIYWWLMFKISTFF
jgi:hypothetical protein